MIKEKKPAQQFINLIDWSETSRGTHIRHYLVGGTSITVELVDGKWHALGQDTHLSLARWVLAPKIGLWGSKTCYFSEEFLTEDHSDILPEGKEELESLRRFLHSLATGEVRDSGKDYTSWDLFNEIFSNE